MNAIDLYRSLNKRLFGKLVEANREINRLKERNRKLSQVNKELSRKLED